MPLGENDGAEFGPLATMLSVLYQAPIWLSGLLLVIILLAAIEVGYRAGFRTRDVWKNAEAGGGNVVLTSMLGLLGLILAFTVASGVSHHKVRKQAVIAEANALGTAFLRADLFADPGRTGLKQALLAYARTRTVASGKALSADRFREIIDRSLQEKAKLWPATQQVLRQNGPAPIVASLVAAVNDVMDLHTIRVAAVFDRLPRIVLVMLVFIAAASLAVAGFNAGISGRMSRWRMTALALVLAGVMLLIIDFDRPISGFIHVDHDSIHSVIAEMEADLAQ
jgi:hypothetical protein